jgi:hypothetical protein
MRNFNKVDFSDAISGKSTKLRFGDIHNPSLRFLHRWMSFMLFPMVELHYVATLELKCLFYMVNRIKYTPVANIVDNFKNMHKISGPIECTSMVTRIAMNLGCLEMANLAYIEGDVLILDLDHSVHAHILREETDYSISMLYGRKAIRLPNPALRLYSFESLTLQFDRTGEACHSFTGPPRTHGRAPVEAVQQTTTTPQAQPQEPSGRLGMGLATRVIMRVVVTIPLTVTPSLASKPEPLPLPRTQASTLPFSGTSVMGLIRLSMQWKGSDNLSDGWMTLHMCKWRCKLPSTRRPA